MPSQSELRKRRQRVASRPVSGGRRHASRRQRRRRLIGLVAIVVAVMMVASLAVGLVSGL